MLNAGELPVILAVEASKGAVRDVFSEQAVMERLLQHRLHELLSTGGC